MGDCDGVSGGVDGGDGDGDSDDGGVVVVGDGGLKTKIFNFFKPSVLRLGQSWKILFNHKTCLLCVELQFNVSTSFSQFSELEYYYNILC